MLSSKRCPHTGVVNFFAAADPHMAVGSIASCGTTVNPVDASLDGFTWRCYAGEAHSSGHAPDIKTAERRLTNFYAMIAAGPTVAYAARKLAQLS
jgi:hypothetical protein